MFKLLKNFQNKYEHFLDHDIFKLIKFNQQFNHFCILIILFLIIVNIIQIYFFQSR